MDRAVVEELVRALKAARRLTYKIQYCGPENAVISKAIARAESELNKPVEMGR